MIVVLNPSVHPGSRANSPGVRLTAREREILRLMAADLTNAQIAERLVVTSETVRWYAKQIYSKLDAHSRDEALQIAQDLRLLRQPDLASVTDQIEPEHPSYVPLPVTPLVGREAELDDVSGYLLRDDIRLVTLTGPPGIGKTRLSLHVAAQLQDAFGDGAFFVGLASISDHTLVSNAIAQVLGVMEVDGQPIIDALKAYLREKRLLLVLDNFEHVLAAAPVVADLLASAADLKVLATSREQLHLYGEQEYLVPPLALPDPDDRVSVDTSAPAQSEAIMLFVQRAHAVKRDFELTTKNAGAIADICIRLDGLPLAIELAAARVKLYPPEELRQRLNNRLNTLTGGARDLPERHRTLRGAIAWSYDLLDAGEQRLFARLGIFVGGWTLEAMGAICTSDLPIDVYDGLESLLNKSLVQQTASDDGNLRFTMLETLREYALERLAEVGEAPIIRKQHAAYFLSLVEHAEPQLRRTGHAFWFAQLRAEEGNLRSILSEVSEVSSAGQEADTVIRIAAALGYFWSTEGNYHEGITWLEKVLAVGANTSPEARAKALAAAATLNNYSENWDRAVAQYESALQLAREVGDQATCARVLTHLGRIRSRENDSSAKQLLEEGLDLARSLGDSWLTATCLAHLGLYFQRQEDCAVSHELLEEAVALFNPSELVLEKWVYMVELGETAAAQGNLAEAKALVEQGISHLRQSRNAVIVAYTLSDLGDVERLRGAFEAARAAYDEALHIWRTLGNKQREGKTLYKMGFVALHQNQLSAAQALFRETLVQAHQRQFRQNIAFALAGFARIAAENGELRRAATLLGAAQAQLGLTQRTFAGFSAPDRTEVEPLIAALQRELDAAAFSAAWESGTQMTLDHAVAYSLETAPPSA